VDIIRIIGGLFIIILGIHLTGLFRIGILDFEKRIHLEKKPVHIFGTVVIGMAFAAGWTPCIGPFLGSILVIAGTQETVIKGVMLLSVYSLGLAIPFISISIFINLLLVVVKKTRKYMPYIMPTAGGLLILTGILLMTNKLNLFTII